MFSHYYIQALKKALSLGHVLLELPVTGRLGNRINDHIDALIFNDSELIVAEFKVGWAQSDWENLETDLVRLRGPVAQEIGKKFTQKQRRHPWIFLGVDCWRKSVADTWKSGKPSIRHKLPDAFANARRDYLQIWKEKGEGFDGYYLMWALLPYDEMFAWSNEQQLILPGFAAPRTAILPLRHS